jgi:hypothetical protein
MKLTSFLTLDITPALLLNLAFPLFMVDYLSLPPKVVKHPLSVLMIRRTRKQTVRLAATVLLFKIIDMRKTIT